MRWNVDEIGVFAARVREGAVTTRPRVVSAAVSKLTSWTKGSGTWPITR
jgi:hypothetical protein